MLDENRCSLHVLVLVHFSRSGICSHEVWILACYELGTIRAICKVVIPSIGNWSRDLGCPLRPESLHHHQRGGLVHPLMFAFTVIPSWIGTQ